MVERAAVVVGFGLTVYGCALVAPPLAFVVAGLLLMVGGLRRRP